MTELHLSINDIETLIPTPVQYARLDNLYSIARVKTDRNSLNNFGRRIRLKGMMIIFLRSGQVSIEINLQRYTIHAGEMLVLNVGALLTEHRAISRTIEWEQLYISDQVLRNLNIDLNAINIRTLINSGTPIMPMTRVDIDRFKPLIALLHDQASRGLSAFSEQIVTSILATFIYQMLQFAFDRIGKDNTSVTLDKNPASRRPISYVHEFIRLLHLNYTRERSTAFYASQLCISPKYLSMIVKDSTGRTVSEWVNGFVLIEAKNLLRFSGMSVQQVAYALNFPSQSSFGKYFKRLTGVSPGEYQRT